MVLGVVLLGWIQVVGTFVGDGISLVPLGLEVHGMSAPISNFGGDSVYGIYPLYKRYGDSSQEEIDEGILISDFTKGNMIIELGDVVSEWQGF